MIRSSRSGLYLPREYVIGEDPVAMTWAKSIFAVDWVSRSAWETELRADKATWDNAVKVDHTPMSMEAIDRNIAELLGRADPAAAVTPRPFIIDDDGARVDL